MEVKGRVVGRWFGMVDVVEVRVEFTWNLTLGGEISVTCLTGDRRYTEATRCFQRLSIYFDVCLFVQLRFEQRF